MHARDATVAVALDIIKNVGDVYFQTLKNGGTLDTQRQLNVYSAT